MTTPTAADVEFALRKAGAAIDSHAAATASYLEAQAAERTARLGSRGYPLPPWADSPTRPTGEQVLGYLIDLVNDTANTGDGINEAEAYLDAWLARHLEAQRLASDRLLKVLDLTSPRPNYRVELDVRQADELGLDVLRLTLAYTEGAKDLDLEARARIAEAAVQAAHVAYEREVADTPAGTCGRGCPCESTP